MNLKSLLSDYSPPGGRLPPPEVVRGLREIDPRMELVYVGQGKWLIGSVEFGSDIHEKAQRVYANLYHTLKQKGPYDVPIPWNLFVERAHNRMRERSLMMQGFRPLQGVIVQEHHLHSGLVEWFRMLDWTWKFGWKEAEAEMEAEADGSNDQARKIKELRDRFDQEGRSIHRHAFRHPVSERSGVDIRDGKIIRQGAQA